METNWIIVAIVIVLSIALIIFIIVKDQRDKKKAIDLLNAENNEELKSSKTQAE